jgi:predicted HicB family RNase H-like nuclease
MNYKSYEAVIHFDENDNIFWGEVVNIPHSMILFHSENAKKLKNEFQISVNAYLETCKQTGREPLRPMSGKILIRTTPNIHSMITAKAKTQGVSVNKFVEMAIVEYASH